MRSHLSESWDLGPYRIYFNNVSEGPLMSNYMLQPLKKLHKLAREHNRPEYFTQKNFIFFIILLANYTKTLNDPGNVPRSSLSCVSIATQCLVTREICFVLSGTCWTALPWTSCTTPAPCSGWRSGPPSSTSSTVFIKCSHNETRRLRLTGEKYQ